MSPAPEPTRTHADSPAAPTRSLADPAVTAAPGERLTLPLPASPSVDRYVLGPEIARGGMGIVYRATDAVLGREIAVKALLEKYAPDSGTARRFADEARIAGQLQHPGVPPVHDLGTLPDGRPFLAMKLIKGDTLDELLNHRTDLTADRGRFVAAFEKVCEAVAYAHSHKVIHRDLKPANVMVGAFGEVQVMDWGLAKVLGERAGADDPDTTSAGTQVLSLRESDAAFTQAGAVLGTPAFMPPEQAVGAVNKIDARSDVFGLGGILAVILTGHPPFAASSSETTRVRAATGDVAECFARLDECGADPELVSLAKRCLSPKHDDRPADAGEVARAVAGLRQAADERVRQAELDRVKAEGDRTAAELRASEQRKRRKVQAALGLAFTVLVLAGGAFAWYSDRQASAERGRLGRNAEAVASLLDQAEAALRAGDAAKAGQFLDAAEKRADEGGADASTGRREALRADLGVLKELDETNRFRWAPDGERRPDAAKVAARFRAVLAGFGADPDAVGADAAAAWVSASAVRDRLVGALDFVLVVDRSPAVRAALRTADPDPYRDAVRDAIVARDRAATAALAVRQEATEQPPGFVAFVGELAAVPLEVRRRLLAGAVQRRPGNLGLLLALVSTYPSQRPDVVDERVRWCQAAVAVAPDNPVSHEMLGLALAKRYQLTGMGDVDEAIACCKEAVRLDPKYSRAHNYLGFALVLKGGTEEGIACYKEAIRLDPKDPNPLNDLGSALGGEKGDWDGAINCFKEAVWLNPTVARYHQNMGWALGNKGDWGEAIAEYKEAIRLNPTAEAYAGLEWALGRKGDVDGAVVELKEALRLDPKNNEVRSNLGDFLYVTGNTVGALAFFREAARENPGHYLWHDWIAFLLNEMGEGAQALPPASEAVRLSPKNAQSLCNLGQARLASGDIDGAVAAFNEARRLNPKHAGATNGLALAERVRPLLPRLPGVLAGTDRPATPTEALQFAELCRPPFQARFAAAVRFYEQALAYPELPVNLADASRYVAACCAARAVRGDGTDAPTDAAGRGTLRAKALERMRVNLARRQKQAASPNATTRSSVVTALTHWLRNPDLTGTRSGLVRIDMTAAERAEWDAFWADVRATLDTAQRPPAPPPKK